MKFVDKGIYKYKFKIDGEWQVANDSNSQDDDVIDLTNGKTVKELLRERQQQIYQNQDEARDSCV